MSDESEWFDHRNAAMTRLESIWKPIVDNRGPGWSIDSERRALTATMRAHFPDTPFTLADMTRIDNASTGADWFHKIVLRTADLIVPHPDFANEGSETQ